MASDRAYGLKVAIDGCHRSQDVLISPAVAAGDDVAQVARVHVTDDEIQRMIDIVLIDVAVGVGAKGFGAMR